MDTTSKINASSGLHPLLWIAGISVTLLSLAGIASLTGILPTRQTLAPEPVAVVAVPAATVPAPVAPTVAVATPPAPALPASKTPPAIAHKTAKKPVEQKIDSAPPAPAVAGGVPPDFRPAPVAAAAPAAPPCPDCGVVADVRQVTREGQGSGAGAVVGGLAGGALGSNIGRGDGRILATVLGAVGGGLLGNSIEKSQRQSVGYQITLRMEDGSRREIDADTLPAWRIGDKVKLVGGAIVAR